MKMTVNITLRDGTSRPIEVDAPDRKTAVRMAFERHPKGSILSVSPRAPNHHAIVIEQLAHLKAACAFVGARWS